MTTSDTTGVINAILTNLKLDPDTPADTPADSAALRLWATISNMSNHGAPVLGPRNEIFNSLRSLPLPTFSDLMVVITAHVEGYAAASSILAGAVAELTARRG